MREQHNWTDEDIELLKEMYQTMTIHKISQRLRLSFSQVSGALKRNNITKNRKWTTADIRQVKELRQTMSMSQAAVKMGVNTEQLRNIMHYHRVIISEV